MSVHFVHYGTARKRLWRADCLKHGPWNLATPKTRGGVYIKQGKGRRRNLPLHRRAALRLDGRVVDNERCVLQDGVRIGADRLARTPRFL